MNKRILTLVLAFVMILGLAVTSFAAPEAEKITNPKVQWLIDKNIVVGRLQDDGKTTVYDLDKTITREEVAKLVILYRGSENLARSLQGTKGIFKDVAIDRWSNGYINVAALADLIVGYPDGNFGPDQDITYAEVAAILVRMNSKWTAADEKAAVWPVSFMKAAEEFGILKDVKIEDANAPAVREKVFEMMYNAFDGKYQAPIANDRLGVVSKVWADSIQLNGDKEYKVTRDTIFVGKSLSVLYKAGDFYGALVRIAVNDDNEITHLVVLGSKGFAYEKEKWLGLIDSNTGDVHVTKTAGTPNPADISDKSNNDKVVFLSGLTLKITDKTRFFVADSNKNNFFEAKKLSDAIDTKEPTHLKGVYAAYDVQPVTGEKYAKVVVFSSGKENEANKVLARVTANVARDFTFKAEDTAAKETEYSIKPFDKAFPYEHGFEKMDVINMTMVGENGVANRDIKIDYSADPIYEVVSIGDVRYNHDGTASFRGNKITLKDKNGTTKDLALSLKGVSVFTNALGKGAHVQVHFEDKANLVVDIISKLDNNTPLRGILPDGKPANEACGIVERIDLLSVADSLLIQIHSDGMSDKYRVAVPEVFQAIGIEPAVIISWLEEIGYPIYDSNPTANELIKIAYEQLIAQKIIKDREIEICYQVKKLSDGIDLIYNIRFSDAFIQKIKAETEEVTKCTEEALAFAIKVKNVHKDNLTGSGKYEIPDVNDDASFDKFHMVATQAQLAELRNVVKLWDNLSDCAKYKLRTQDLVGLGSPSIVDASGKPVGPLEDIIEAVEETDEELAKLDKVREQMRALYDAIEGLEFGIEDYVVGGSLASVNDLRDTIKAKLGLSANRMENACFKVKTIEHIVSNEYAFSYTVEYYKDDIALSGKWANILPSPMLDPNNLDNAYITHFDEY